jgi:hypothetical protein
MWIFYVKALCGGNARRRMEMSWKEDLRGAMFLAR